MRTENRAPFFGDRFSVLCSRLSLTDVEQTSIYCQNCRTANSLRETHCQNCGTRLLLVIFPNSLQYDSNQVPSFYEDHLLERVTLLEHRLTQLTEGLQAAMEIIREQGKIIKEEHSMVKSLYQMLGLLKTEDAEKIRRDFDNLRQKNANGRDEKERKAQHIENIISQHEAPNAELFSRLLTEATKLFAQNEEKQAFRMLERAVLLSPKNLSLRLFIAENLLRADKFSEARKHLEKGREIAPGNLKLAMLLGALAADEGAPGEARALLGALSVKDAKTGFLVNFIEGFLAASEENWKQSLTLFKNAASQSESPEIQYLIGCVLFQTDDEITALKHFQNTVLLDEKYTDAWFMQAVIARRQKNKKEEKNLLAAALLKAEAGAQCTELLRRNKFDLEIALPFQHFRDSKARLLTGGSLRLRRFFKNELEKALKI